MDSKLTANEEASTTDLRPVVGLQLTIINQYYVPDTASTGYLLSQLAETLADQGVQVEVLTCQPSYGPPESWQTRPRDELVQGIRIHRLRTLRASKDRLAGRALAGLSFFAALSVWQMFRSSTRQVNLYCTNPPMLPFVGAMVSVFRRHRYVFLLHDAYPQIASIVGKIRPKSWVAWLWHRGNAWSLRRAHSVIVLCEKAKELVVREYRIPSEKVHVIPNWADERSLSPVPKSSTQFAREHKLVEPFTLLYSGNLGLYYDFDTVLDAAAMLQHENFRLVLIGAGGKRFDLENEIRRRGLTNTTLHPYQPIELLNDSLNACDASLVTIARGVEGISFPSKLYTSLAVGKAIVAISEDDSELRRLVESNHCGIWCRLGDSTQLADDVRHLMRDKSRSKDMGAAARDLFLRAYTRKKSGAAYARVLSDAAAPYRESH